MYNYDDTAIPIAKEIKNINIRKPNWILVDLLNDELLKMKKLQTPPIIAIKLQIPKIKDTIDLPNPCDPSFTLESG